MSWTVYEMATACLERFSNTGRRFAASAATADGARFLHELERLGQNRASHTFYNDGREAGALRALPRNDPDLNSGKFQHYRSRLRENTGG